jgi:hypothetical protein
MKETDRVLGEYGYADEDDQRGLGWCDPEEEAETQATYLNLLIDSDDQNNMRQEHILSDTTTGNKEVNEDKIEAYADRLGCSYHEASLRYSALSNRTDRCRLSKDL